MRHSLLLVLSGMVISTCSTANAAWLLFDSFNDYDLGTHVDGQGDWVSPLIEPVLGSRNIVADPALPANHVLEYFSNSTHVSSSPAYVSKSLGSLKSDDLDNAHTMFMRLYVPDYTGVGTDDGPDIMFALKAGPVIDSGSSGMGPHLRIDGNSSKQTILQVNPNNEGFVTLNTSSVTAPTLESDTWYNMWMVTDNNADNFQIYIQGGTGAFATQQQLQLGTGVGATTDLLFRDNRAFDADPDDSGVKDQNLDTLWFRANSAHTNGYALFDQILIDHDQSLTVPSPSLLVPEPSTMATLLLGIIAIGASRNRWMAKG